MNLPKIHSITKKLFVALVGSFLLLFLLFHMTANLFVLRHDEGAWYSAFCHFMGTNWIVKVVEVVLLCVVLLHICLTLWLVATNYMARPVRYHQKQQTKTHTTSKLMMWTGLLIFAFLVMHFCQFYFVKIGWVKGEYMVEAKEVQTEEVMALQQYAAQQGMTPTEFLDGIEAQMAMYMAQLDPEQQDLMQQDIENMRNVLPIAEMISDAQLSDDGKWIRHISYEQRQMLRQRMPDCGVEPDFYYMVRQLFQHPVMVLLYLLTFLCLFSHMRHAFPSAFQTLGLNNYKYNNIIEWCGRIYAWIVCIGFAIVPILIYLGL